MVLFNKLQNNFLINRSNRYLVTKCIIFLFFLLQGFSTSNVLAAGLRNEQIYSNDLENWNVKQGVSERSVHEVREYANTPQFNETNSPNHLSINLPHPDPTTHREYFENEIEATLQLIYEARGELEILKQKYNSHRVTKAFGKKNNYYSGELKLLEADYLTLLDSQKEYSSKKNMIEEKISDNETLKDIKEKGLILINQLIDEGQNKYYSDEVQTNDDKNSLVELETYLSTKEAELKQSSCQDDVTSILNAKNVTGRSDVR